MGDHKEIKLPQSASYSNLPEYKDHVNQILTSYDSPEGVLGELVRQMAEAIRRSIKELEVIDRLIERQFKNMRLLMQSYESVRFAPQLLNKMDLEIKQLEQGIEKTIEDQRREVSRQ